MNTAQDISQELIIEWDHQAFQEPKTVSLRAAPQAESLLGLLTSLVRSEFVGVCDIAADEDLYACLYFSAGQVVHAAMPDRCDALGHVLYDLQMIDLYTYGETMRQAQLEGRLHGEILLELRLIDEPRLHYALGLQLHRKLRRILSHRGARYSVRSDAHLYGANAALREALPHPWQVVYLATRYAELKETIAAIKPHFDRFACIPEARVGELARYGFGEAGMRAGESLAKGAVRLRDLLAEERTRNETGVALAAMLLTDLLEILPEGRKRTEIARSRSEHVAYAPPRRRATDARATPEVDAPPADPVRDETATELRRRIDVLDNQDHFQVLGVPRTAGAEEIRTEFMKLAKRFHPDRVTALGLRYLIVEADRYFQRLSEARATLIEPNARQRYQELLEHAQVTGIIQRQLDAERYFQRGEQVLARGDVAAALEQFQRAVANNTDEADYRASLAWARYLIEKNDPDERVLAASEAKKMLWHTIQRWPEKLRAYLFMARVLADVAELPLAISCLRKAAQVDETNFEIQRELHLFERRAAQNASRGLLAKAAEVGRRVRGR